MATLCKNCGGPLIFEPSNGKMNCKICGSVFDVNEIEITDRELLEEIKVLSAKEVFGADTAGYYDCHIYTCSSCGGDVILNKTESSTYCLYCGNPTIVFNRVSKQKRPEFILPFKVTRERAVELIREEVKKGFFVPKEIRNFDPELVRGIYIPYWIVNGTHYNAAFIKETVTERNSNSRHSRSRVETIYHGRAGEFKIRHMTLDASEALNDNSSMKLEPFDLTELEEFDENYLTGFYSDIADVKGFKVATAANYRADQMFCEEALNDCRGFRMEKKSLQIITSEPHTVLEEDMVYAMMPCWFVTTRYKGDPITILVNGESGKVVCTLPFNKKLFIALTVLVTLLCAFVIAIMAKGILDIIFPQTSYYHHSRRGSSDGISLFLYVGAAAGTALFAAIRRMKKFLLNLSLTKSVQTFKYVKKRQG